MVGLCFILSMVLYLGTFVSTFVDLCYFDLFMLSFVGFCVLWLWYLLFLCAKL